MRDGVGRKVDVSRVGEPLSKARGIGVPELGAHGHGAADFVLSMHENLLRRDVQPPPAGASGPLSAKRAVPSE
jgi:hypothetical protein